MNGQRGVALITVLLVLFIAALSAAALLRLDRLTIRRTAVLLDSQQARLLKKCIR